MILCPSAHLALDKIFIPQACLHDTGLLAMPPTFIPSLYGPIIGGESSDRVRGSMA
jgi:hypothetical protein